MNTKLAILYFFIFCFTGSVIDFIVKMYQEWVALSLLKIHFQDLNFEKRQSIIAGWNVYGLREFMLLILSSGALLYFVLFGVPWK